MLRWIQTELLAPLKSHLVSVLVERSPNFCPAVCYCFHQLDLVKCEDLGTAYITNIQLQMLPMHTVSNAASEPAVRSWERHSHGNTKQTNKQTVCFQSRQVRLRACTLGHVSWFHIRLGSPPRLKTAANVNLTEEAWVPIHAVSFLLYSHTTNHLHCP